MSSAARDVIRTYAFVHPGAPPGLPCRVPNVLLCCAAQKRYLGTWDVERERQHQERSAPPLTRGKGHATPCDPAKLALEIRERPTWCGSPDCGNERTKKRTKEGLVVETFNGWYDDKSIGTKYEVFHLRYTEEPNVEEAFFFFLSRGTEHEDVCPQRKNKKEGEN